MTYHTPYIGHRSQDEVLCCSISFCRCQKAKLFAIWQGYFLILDCEDVLEIVTEDLENCVAIQVKPCLNFDMF